MRARRGTTPKKAGHGPEEGGESSENNNEGDHNINNTMSSSSPFAAGINQRKGKHASSTRASHCPHGDDNDHHDQEEEAFRKRPTHRLLFLKRYRGGGRLSTGTIIATLSLLCVIFLLARDERISQALVLFRVTNPGWGKHPRVTELEKDKDDNSKTGENAAAYNVVVNLPQEIKGGSFPVPPLASKKFLERLADSDEYNDVQDVFETDTCKAQYDWQLRSFPSCNHLHERALTTIPLVGHGYWRDVWVVPETSTTTKMLGENHVLKTIRWEHDYTERNYDRHRRDALAMERLTSHPLVMDIYGYCGNSGLFEFAPGGDIADALWPKESHIRKYGEVSEMERLYIAVQAAIGLAAVHNFDEEGRASVAHTDISPGQFVRVGDLYKLNDFNRARFIRKNIQTGENCPFHVGNNPGKNRSPEEYSYQPETEKVDVYSLGNIFYMLLTNMWPYHGVKEKTAKKNVVKGVRPVLFADIVDSTDPIDIAIRTAMYMCHETDPVERASARQVETYLKERLEEIDPGRLDEWLQPATS